MIFTKMADMAMSPDEQKQEMGCCAPASDTPKPIYPWGLCINLGDDELKKINLDSNCAVGDYVDLVVRAKVTDRSERDTDKGPKCRVELQITEMGILGGDEDDKSDKQRDRYANPPKG